MLRLGPGTTVGHGAIVNAELLLVIHCVINTNSSIEHDVQIGNYCHISTGVLVNGGVSLVVDFIGSGAMIRDGLTFPPSTIISAGKRIMGWPLITQ